MKRILLLVFSCISFLATAQILNQEYKFSANRESDFNASVYYNGVTYVAGSTGICYEGGNVMAFDDMGELLWNTNLESEFILNLRDVVVDINNSRVIATGSFYEAHDVGAPWDGPRVYALDFNGNILWETNFEEQVYGTLFFNPNLNINDASELHLAVNNTIFKLSNTGTVVSQTVRI